jgi:hypothetical protein
MSRTVLPYMAPYSVSGLNTISMVDIVVSTTVSDSTSTVVSRTHSVAFVIAIVDHISSTPFFEVRLVERLDVLLP